MERERLALDQSITQQAWSEEPALELRLSGRLDRHSFLDQLMAL